MGESARSRREAVLSSWAGRVPEPEPEPEPVPVFLRELDEHGDDPRGKPLLPCDLVDDPEARPGLRCAS